MNVLIVEDSLVLRQLLRYILEQAGINVIGEAGNGQEALDFVANCRPDVITMDIHMPVMDGIEATRRIMETCPIPIVVVSASYTLEESATALRVLEAGAITVVQKPCGPTDSYFERDAQLLVKTVRCMADVKLIRRIPRPPAAIPVIPTGAFRPMATQPKIVAIGASTGGPQALRSLLATLHPNLPWPVLVVQHISPGFLSGFCEWLNGVSTLPVTVAQQGEILRAGHVYLAPDNQHMEVSNPGVIRLTDDEPINGLRPAAASLFASVSRHYGARSVAILLSGMGRDGANEMLQLKTQGAMTLVQSADTAVVNGMPGAAVKLGAACHALAPDDIAAMLNQLITIESKS